MTSSIDSIFVSSGFCQIPIPTAVLVCFGLPHTYDNTHKGGA